MLLCITCGRPHFISYISLNKLHLGNDLTTVDLLAGLGDGGENVVVGDGVVCLDEHRLLLKVDVDRGDTLLLLKDSVHSVGAS